MNDRLPMKPHEFESNPTYPEECRRCGDSHDAPIHELDGVPVGDAEDEGPDVCRATGVAPFVKQLGAAPYFTRGAATVDLRLKDSHGGDWSEWPEGLRVREYPIIANSLLL